MDRRRTKEQGSDVRGAPIDMRVARQVSVSGWVAQCPRIGSLGCVRRWASTEPAGHSLPAAAPGAASTDVASVASALPTATPIALPSPTAPAATLDDSASISSAQQSIASSGGSSAHAVAQGPMTLEQAMQSASTPGMQTIPVPVLVGPSPAVPLPSIEHAAATVDTATTVPTAGGFFFSKPMALVELLLVNTHDATGLPWWATIAVTTMSVRMALVPLQIYQSKSIAKLALIKPKMTTLSEHMRNSAAKGTEKGNAEAERARLELQALFEQHNVRPWMSIVGALGQLPLWITFFFTMRHIVRPDSGLGLDTGGMLWFTDLTARDPYFTLPALCGATFFGMVHLGDPGTAAGAKEDDRQAMMKQMMKGVAVLMPAMTAWFESGVFIYWISTNCFAISQTVLLRQAVIRAAAGLPPIPPIGVGPAQPALGASSEAGIEPPPDLRVNLGGSRPPEHVPKAAAKGRGRRRARK